MSKKYIKWDIEKAKKLFKNNGCKLLEEIYISAKTKMRYICSCEFKTEAEISLDCFKRGRRCKKCGIERMVEKQRLTFKEVKQYFEDHDCELLEEEYINNHTKMKYKCDCGNEECKIIFNEFQKGGRCIECSGHKKFTYEEVYNYFKDHDCELFETEYKNSKTKMEYRCDCGNSDCRITFNKFKSGGRCMKCAIEKHSGEGHPNYNPNLTDEERLIGRNYPEYREWRTTVYEKDNYICQCCGKGGKLNAHHIKNYADNEELRLVVSNGVTLCEEHHIEFHKKYGKRNNTREQFNDFIKIGVI